MAARKNEGIRNDPDTIALVAKLHAEGKSRSFIAKQVGCAASTIGLIADDLGLAFDRQAMAAAVQNKQADNRIRRAALADRLYAQAERDLARLEASNYTHRVNAGQSSFVVTDEVPNSDEVRNHMQAVYSALASATKLEALDLDPGVANAKSTLTAISQALGLVPKGSS